MKKLILVTLLSVFFCFGGKAQRESSYAVVKITSGTWFSRTQTWTYDPTSYPNGMKLIMIDNTIYVQDKAKSFYRMGATMYPDKVVNGYSSQTWYAIDERNRDCNVTMRVKLATNESTITVMYDLGSNNFRLYEYTFFLD